MRLFIVWFFLAGLFFFTATDACANCESCGSPMINVPAYRLKDPLHGTTKVVCETCYKSDLRCSACAMPVGGKNFQKLDDGRLLCEADAKTAVFAQDEAERIFEEVKRDAHRLLAEWPPLPDANITATLVNRDQFLREFRKTPAIEDPTKLLGLTLSAPPRDKKYAHTIFLLNGLPRPQLMAVCAHEYAHTWVNEHWKRTRQIDKDSVEGFCELIAYKVMDLRNEEAEKKRILQSDYTRGQIQTVLKAEEEYRFFRVIAWVCDGVDSWLDKEKLDRLLVLKTDAAPAPGALAAYAPREYVAPDSLMLKGLLGAGPRRVALINDRSLGLMEADKVRVGKTNVTVRCLEFRANSVLVQVNGSTAKQELFLRKN